MILFYQIVAVFLLFFTLYYGIHALASFLNFRKPKGAYRNQSTEPLSIFIPAFQVGMDFANNLKNLSDSLRIDGVRLYVLFQETEESVIAESKRYIDDHDKASFRDKKGNPYHHALAFATEQLKQRWNLSDDAPLLLLDPDNMISQNSVEILVARFQEGFDAVQGKRKASGASTQTGWVDAASEELNDLLWRSGKQQLGLIPELSGSGIIFRFGSFFKAVHQLDHSAPGMDKNLLIQLMLSDKDLRIRYCPDAVLYDEKTNDEEAFGRQRIRWFGNQYYNAIHWSGSLLLKSFTQFRLRYIDYALTLWRPPRSVHVLLTTMLIPVDLYLLYTGTIAVSFHLPAIILWVLILTPVALRTKPEKISTSTFGIIKLVAGNLVSAIKGISSKVKGTFISTREKSSL